MRTCPEHRPSALERTVTTSVIWRVGLCSALGGLVALGPSPAAADPARSQPIVEARIASVESVGVANLRVAPAGEAAPADVFGAGTTVIDARFRYVEAEGEEIELVIRGLGGIECFRHVATYMGSGEANVPISGASMYPVIAETLASSVLEAKRNAKSASSRTFGIKEFLLSAQAGVIRARFAADTVLAAAPPHEIRGHAETVRAVVAAAHADLAAAIELPESDVDGMQSIAAAVDTALGEAVLASRELQAAAPGVAGTTMRLPASGADSYLLQAIVDGAVAATTEFRVEAGRSLDAIYLPRVATN